MSSEVLQWQQPLAVRQRAFRPVLVILLRWLMLLWGCGLLIGAVAVFAMRSLNPEQIPFVIHLMIVGCACISAYLSLMLVGVWLPKTYKIKADALVASGTQIRRFPATTLVAYRIATDERDSSLRTLQFQIKSSDKWHLWTFDPAIVSPEQIRSAMNRICPEALVEPSASAHSS